MATGSSTLTETWADTITDQIWWAPINTIMSVTITSKDLTQTCTKCSRTRAITRPNKSLSTRRVKVFNRATTKACKRQPSSSVTLNTRRSLRRYSNKWEPWTTSSESCNFCAIRAMSRTRITTCSPGRLVLTPSSNKWWKAKTHCNQVSNAPL